MRDTAPFWTLAQLVTDKTTPSLFQVSLEDMVPDSGRLVDSELSRYEADGTPFAKGDVLFGKLRPYLAKYWLADQCGTAGGDIHVYRPTAGVDPRFLRYIVGSRDFTRYAEAASKGVKMPRVEWMGIREFRVHRPDSVTQTRVADYLDRETGAIDAMITKLDDLATSLGVRKVSFIQRATQFNAIGDRWNAVPTAHLFGLIGSGTTPKGAEYYTEAGDGVPWVTTSELRESEILDTAKHVTHRALEEISSLKVHPRGSIAIAMYGATIGRLGTFGVDASTNQACCVFSNPRGVDMRFFYYTLWGQRDDIIRLAVGGGQPNISQTMLRRWRVPCPPVEDQKRIADHIDKVTGRIDAMLAKVAELKALLLERRSALITDVVTGRKVIA